jgi:putative tryptophan/tyrosine transport system substrate-binding protein
MRRREFMALLNSAAAAWPLGALAQLADRMRRVGMLTALAENDAEGQLRAATFRQSLQMLGWIEGQNIHIDYRWPGGDAERIRA